MSAGTSRIIRTRVAFTIAVIKTRQTTVIVGACTGRIRNAALRTDCAVGKPTWVTCEIRAVTCCIRRACITKFAVQILIRVTGYRVRGYRQKHQQKHDKASEHVSFPPKKTAEKIRRLEVETTSNEIAGLFNIFTTLQPGFGVLCS